MCLLMTGLGHRADPQTTQLTLYQETRQNIGQPDGIHYGNTTHPCPPDDLSQEHKPGRKQSLVVWHTLLFNELR
jgi:hypothetical protein